MASGSTQARALFACFARNLDEGTVLAARRLPRGRVLYPSEVNRLPRGGVPRLIAGITREELLAHVSIAISEPTRIWLLHEDSLMLASDVVRLEAPVILAGLERLIDRVTAGAPTWAEGLERLIGADEVGGGLISLEERAMRVTKALLTAVAAVPLRERAPGVPFDPEILFAPNLADGTSDLLDATVEFVRAHVMRVPYEHSHLAELMLKVRLEPFKSAAVQVRHQIPLPAMLGGTLKPGTDTVIYFEDFAHFVELKAFRSVDSLHEGHLSFTWADGAVVKVSGAKGPLQITTDGLRVLHWDGKVPPHGVDPPANGSLPPDSDDWPAVAPLSVMVVDDTYLVNRALDLVLYGLRPRGKPVRTTVDLTKHVTTDPAEQQRLMELFGTQIVTVRNEADWILLHDRAHDRIALEMAGYQDDINTYLMHPEVVGAMGGVVRSVRLVLGSAGPEGILDAFGIPRPRP